MAASSPFYINVDIGRTVLLLADIQSDIAARLPPNQVEQLSVEVCRLLTLFRNEIHKRRSSNAMSDSIYDNVPLIVHHIFPAGINSNGFISPYNKLAKWFKKLESTGHFDNASSDPNHPSYKILDSLRPPNDRWGSKDEIIVSKITAGCFSSSELQGYLRARGIQHVVLCGLTTAGAILGSARLGADLDFHVIVPKGCVMDDDLEVNEFFLNKILPRFVDVVDTEDVEALFTK